MPCWLSSRSPAPAQSQDSTIWNRTIGPPLCVYVLIVHQDADSVATLLGKLVTDAEYTKAAATYLGARADDPAYQRIESSLLVALGGMPRLERPDPAKPRLLNLRVYESPSE